MKKNVTTPATKVLNEEKESDEAKIAFDNSLFGKMIKTKVVLKAYLRGDFTLSELESMGIEIS